MKGFMKIVVVVTLVAHVSGQDGVCGIDKAPLPVHDDCTAYDSCTSGAPVRESCPPGQYYNCLNRICSATDPWVPCCEGDVDLPASSTSCVEDGVKIRYNCGQYFECSGGKVLTSNCSNGQEFSSYNYTCVNVFNESCMPSTATTTATTTQENTSDLPEDLGISSSTSSTPTSTIPTTQENTSDLPEDLRISSSTSSTPTSTITTTQENTSDLPEDLGISTSTSSIPTSTIPTTQENTSDLPEDLGISSSTSSSPTSTMPTIQENTSDLPEDLGISSSMSSTPTSTISITLENTSDLPEDLGISSTPTGTTSTSTTTTTTTTTTTPVTTTTTTTPTTTTTTKTPTTTTSICTSNNSKIINPNNCRQYYECVNGIKQLSTCPGIKYFNCWNSKCENVIQTTCCNIGIPPFGPCINNGQKTANVKNCTKYYECSNYWMTKKSCNSGQKFDQWKKTCVPEAQASCAASVDFAACKVIKSIPFVNWVFSQVCP